MTQFAFQVTQLTKCSAHFLSDTAHFSSDATGLPSDTVGFLSQLTEMPAVSLDKPAVSLEKPTNILLFKWQAFQVTQLAHQLIQLFFKPTYWVSLEMPAVLEKPTNNLLLKWHSDAAFQVTQLAYQVTHFSEMPAVSLDKPTVSLEKPHKHFVIKWHSWHSWLTKWYSCFLSQLAECHLKCQLCHLINQLCQLAWKTHKQLACLSSDTVWHSLLFKWHNWLI